MLRIKEVEKRDDWDQFIYNLHGEAHKKYSPPEQMYHKARLLIFMTYNFDTVKPQNYYKQLNEFLIECDGETGLKLYLPVRYKFLT